jgi:hypothetical protein
MFDIDPFGNLNNTFDDTPSEVPSPSASVRHADLDSIYSKLVELTRRISKLERLLGFATEALVETRKNLSKHISKSVEQEYEEAMGRNSTEELRTCRAGGVWEPYSGGYKCSKCGDVSVTFDADDYDVL